MFLWWSELNMQAPIKMLLIHRYNKPAEILILYFFYSFMVLGFNFHYSFFGFCFISLDMQMSRIHFMAWSRWGSQPSKQRTKLKPSCKLLKAAACCKWIFKSNHTWASFLTIASLSVLSGMYAHVACTFDHVFSSVFLP